MDASARWRAGVCVFLNVMTITYLCNHASSTASNERLFWVGNRCTALEQPCLKLLILCRVWLCDPSLRQWWPPMHVLHRLSCWVFCPLLLKKQGKRMHAAPRAGDLSIHWLGCMCVDRLPLDYFDPRCANVFQPHWNDSQICLFHVLSHPTAHFRQHLLSSGHQVCQGPICQLFF